MDIADLLRIGATLIQNNDDEATTSIDTDKIADALGSIFGSKEGEGGLDLGNIISAVTNGNLGEIVSSWIGEGENKPIEPESVTELLGEEKIEEFANQLGVSIESAKKALADALPEVVDKATSPDSNILGDLLDKVGGIDGAMDLVGKLFGNNKS
ncbi:MAG: DUF937 domain-containing protein [Epsilonproteobacteria bacterium]|nr:DUF937 domain-containing protein [Campylobacterota bacterium]